MARKGTIKISIEQTKKLVKKLDKLKDEKFKEHVSKVVTGTIAARVRDEAKRIAYVAPERYRVYDDSGTGYWVEPAHVARNIIMKYLSASESDDGKPCHIVTVSNSHDGIMAKRVAFYVEYGINFPRPYPFLRPAFDSVKGKARLLAIERAKKEFKKKWKN